MIRASRPWEALYIYFTERSCPRRSPVFPDLPSRRCLAMSEQKSPHGSLELAQDQPLPAVLSLPGSSPTSTTLETTPCDFLVIPVPRYLRHNPAKPVPSSLFLNIIFAVATTFSECSVCAKHGGTLTSSFCSCREYILVSADPQYVVVVQLFIS